MTARHDQQDPALALAEGLAAMVERWSLAQCGDALLARLAASAALQLSLAIAAGHVCLPLSAWADTDVSAGEAAALRQRLLASGVVGPAQAPASLPLILDGADRLYLHRQFDQERRLAQRLLRAAGAAPAAIDAPTRLLLRQLFADAAKAGDAPTGPDWQQLAAALALRQRLVVISGGPGTGKTSTVFKLLACVLSQQPAARVALAAPTGKAAARLGQAMRQHAALLPAGLRERMPTQAATVHRLLGAHADGFVHHAGNPLAIDMLVVDEASMLDLSLATRLMAAMPDGARIVLLGDKDQLAAVESGAVFAELSAEPGFSAAGRAALAELCALPADTLPPAATPPGALQDSVVWFTRNYRFAAGSGISRAAEHIRQGRSAELLDLLRDGADSSLRWWTDDAVTPGAATWRHIVDGFAPYFERVQSDADDVAGIHHAFERFRVLCAQREGPRGTLALNEQLSLRARAHGGGPAAAFATSPWYPGRPVMVLRNDPLLQLFNGDIGIALPDAEGRPMVWFTAADGGFRSLAPLRLPAHETAFAMTVHKAQGSEFEALLLLLPDQRSRVLTRELLYTAVTRARQQVLLAAGANVLAAAVDAPMQRHSGLRARLREAAAAAAGA